MTAETLPNSRFERLDIDTWQGEAPSFLEPCCCNDAAAIREALTSFVTKLVESRDTIEDAVRE